MEETLITVFVTVPDRTVAEKVSRAVVEDRLAACVNIVPGIESIYRWQGTTETSSELLLIMKTTRSRFSQLELGVLREHPSDTPEIIATTISDVTDRYKRWVIESVS